MTDKETSVEEADEATEKTPKREAAKFSRNEPADEQTAKDQWATFAKDLSTEQIQVGLDQMFEAGKGDLRGELADRYEGFSIELQRRTREDAAAKSRMEQQKFRHLALQGRLEKAPEAEVFASTEYKAAFTKYLRTGDGAIMAQFAQSIAGDGTQGGYAVPDGFLNKIVESMKAYGGIAGIADSFTTSDGQPLRFPTNDDTANSAAIATEGSAVGSGGADKVLGNVTLGAFSYDATGASNLPLLVSKELIQDAGFDIEAWVARNLATRLGRKMAADFANGTGTTMPFGLFSKTPDSMGATTAYAAFVEHFFQVDEAYRDNARWVMSDTVLAKVYGSVDNNGRPLFIPESNSSGAGAPAGFILGKPVTLDQASASNVAFGDIKLGYIIRYVRGVQVDVDPYSNIKSRQVAYHAWARADANIQDSKAYSVSDYSSVNADAEAS